MGGGIFFEWHEVGIQKAENIKHSVSISSCLHKEASDYVSLRGGVEFHAHTQ